MSPAHVPPAERRSEAPSSAVHVVNLSSARVQVAASLCFIVPRPELTFVLLSPRTRTRTRCSTTRSRLCQSLPRLGRARPPSSAGTARTGARGGRCL
eukprot:2052396-Rhodomonas_salina.1